MSLPVRFLCAAILLICIAGCSGGSRTALPYVDRPQSVASSGKQDRPSVSSVAAMAASTFKMNGWQKYPEPVLAWGSGFDSVYLRDMSIVINDTDGTVYRDAAGELRAYYGGCSNNVGYNCFAVGTAVSDDNGYTWKKQAEPVLTPSGKQGSWYQTDIGAPSVIRVAATGQIYMMAQGGQLSASAEPPVKSIGLLMSSDGGVTWSDQGQQITADMVHYEPGLQEDESPTEMGVPRVIKLSSGIFLVTFEGEYTSSTVSSDWRIWGAVAEKITGPWTPLNGGAPIYTPSSAWDAVGVANPQVVEVTPGSFVLAYNGINVGISQASGPYQSGTAVFCTYSQTTGWHVGFAATRVTPTSWTPRAWEPYSGNPVLQSSGATAFDQWEVETSFLAKADAYGVAKLYFHGYGESAPGSPCRIKPQVGVATASWVEFNHLFAGALAAGAEDSAVYSRRVDGALQRIVPPTNYAPPFTGPWYKPWEQIGSGWNEFTQIFNGKDTGPGGNGNTYTYAILANGQLLRNTYSSAANAPYSIGTWSGWQYIGTSWSNLTTAFMGIDGWIYAVRSNGIFSRSLYNDSTGIWKTQLIGNGWNEFAQVFMGTDGWIYAVQFNGRLSRYLLNTTNLSWQVQSINTSGWNQYSQVFAGTDGWIYATTPAGHLIKNLYIPTSNSFKGWVEP